MSRSSRSIDRTWHRRSASVTAAARLRISAIGLFDRENKHGAGRHVELYLAPLEEHAGDGRLALLLDIVARGTRGCLAFDLHRATADLDQEIEVSHPVEVGDPEREAFNPQMVERHDLEFEVADVAIRSQVADHARGETPLSFRVEPLCP
jgi:hypothetical protein